MYTLVFELPKLSASTATGIDHKVPNVRRVVSDLAGGLAGARFGDLNLKK